MSLKSTKEQLAQLLTDEDTKVIALSGKWGTGKSYMWDQVQRESEDETVKGALYSSLFGLSTIDQVKLKLLQNAAPALEKSPALLESAKKVYGTTVKVLETFHKGFGALNDVGLLVAPAILRGKLIVLDDIERKHDKLSIDEVLGFIDEFTQRFGARFLLILNSDRLMQKEVWDTLREKVVDEELRLTTSCDEAFEIAVRHEPSKWEDSIAVAVSKCGLTNIRILGKVIRAVNRVIGERAAISAPVLVRVVPSAVLLATIHYKGIENGPDVNYVLGFGSSEGWNSFLKPKNSETQTEEEKRQSQWQSLMTSLGINSCDEFELLVFEYLQSGLFDVSKVAAIIDGYETEHEATAARNAVNLFFQRSFWEHRLTEAELLEEAKLHAEKVHLLDAYTVTAFADLLLELPGGEPLAREVIAKWIAVAGPTLTAASALDNFFHRKVHPEIEALFQQFEKKAQTDTSVLDACKHIVASNGWGARQEMALQSATVEAFEDAIRTADTRDLQLLLAKMLEFAGNRTQYEKHFGSGMINFVEACRRIASDPAVPRLAKILRHLSSGAKLEGLLEMPSPIPGALPPTEGAPE